MKKTIRRICLLMLTCIVAFGLVACKKSKNVKIDGDFVVIVADQEKFEQGDTLKSYMELLQEEGQFTFVISDGMVTSIDGKSGGANEYWMLYTDDEANANEAWGICEYDGKTYKSVTLGAEALEVKDGCTYIWYLQAF